MDEQSAILAAHAGNQDNVLNHVISCKGGIEFD
jgi:hypothetical protein